ncbi:maleylpyruvate isomerase family protein [Nocardioides humilatus]|uniref:Maleylpyruvate isomerase family protein n=1 Tax=Nocardioides humilatus TaxID=2607660 RepID=A0A5B1L653_9ACTN|nr:maleylpyruvate isomerase N-terminal domain-containing protein [Nocardioides humilatus]KAA1415259.1 maleylpyruvate isomerase family protein [Nocardioides humilatus]
MPRLSFSDYLTAIRRESARFRDVLADCDPEAPVASCPDWTADDLLWHLATVHHWWCAMVTNRPQSPDAMGYEEPPRPEGHAALLAAFDEQHAAFVAAIEEADPSEPAWSWSGDLGNHTVAFTYRRQAHEALIHRLDAELAAGEVTPLDPALAADGVDETLDVMYGNLPAWGTFEALPRYVEFRMSDAGTSVWTQLGIFAGVAPDGEAFADEKDMHVVPDPGIPADTVVEGTADDLDAWLWHRRDDTGITVTGDRSAYDHARVVLDHPID